MPSTTSSTLAQEAKEREYYGFVLYVVSYIFILFYLIIALVPDQILNYVDFDFPDKYLGANIDDGL